jgi:hypothetical protein
MAWLAPHKLDWHSIPRSSFHAFVFLNICMYMLCNCIYCNCVHAWVFMNFLSITAKCNFCHENRQACVLLPLKHQ